MYAKRVYGSRGEVYQKSRNAAKILTGEGENAEIPLSEEQLHRLDFTPHTKQIFEHINSVEKYRGKTVTEILRGNIRNIRKKVLPEQSVTREPLHRRRQHNSPALEGFDFP